MASTTGAGKPRRAPVERVIQARSGFAISTQSSASARSLTGGGGGRFFVHLRCHAQRSLEMSSSVRREEEKATETTFVVHDAGDLLSEDACSRLIRWMLTQRPPLAALGLTEEELETLVRKMDVVRKIVQQARFMEEMGVMDVCCTFAIDLSLHLTVVALSSTDGMQRPNRRL